MIFAQSTGEVIECLMRFAIFTKRGSGNIFFFFFDNVHSLANIIITVGKVGVGGKY